MTQPDAPLSPLWWVKRLHDQLKRQRETFDLYDAYYRGRPPRMPWLPEQAQQEFSRLLSLSNSNYMGLVVDAMVERQIVEGFRIGKELAGDAKTWEIWQANNLDAYSDQILLEAAIGGCSFLLVAPPDETGGDPLIYPEHPTQATVAYEPGSGRRKRAAGLKVWLDDWTGMQMATLYLPDRIYKFQAPKQTQGVVGDIRWEVRRVPNESWPAKNPLGEVPLVEVANNPRMLTGGVSELADVVAIQDRINKTLADRLMTQDFGAFPQKWAIGYPETDADGNKNRVDVGRDRLVTSDIAETKFGQFESAPLDPYSAAKREDVKDVASRTRTPAQYLLGEMSNVNGETLKASESGLVSKVRQRNRTAGEGFEGGVGLARRVKGIATPGEMIETKWRNPEFRTEGELVDALTKMQTLNVPDEALWERWGASELEIARWKEQAAEQAQRDPVASIARGLAETGAPVEPVPADVG